MIKCGTAHNRTVTAAGPYGPSALRLARSCFTPTPHYGHIWAARNPTGVFIVPPKRQLQPERYAKCQPNWLKNYKNNILTKYIEGIYYNNGRILWNMLKKRKRIIRLFLK
jgi:hypothetical protein